MSQEYNELALARQLKLVEEYNRQLIARNMELSKELDKVVKELEKLEQFFLKGG